MYLSFNPRSTKKLNILVGKPIEFQRVADPTQEQIDELHNRFIEELVNLFEKHKHKYVPNAESTQLEFV